jgi:succinate dehydrogenase / fumarate reductase, membrane anchor subunit
MTDPFCFDQKRVGAGRPSVLFDWFMQRMTAVLMTIYTFILLIWLLCATHFSYEGWVSIFAVPWMKFATLTAFLSLCYHAWVGMRDIWIDYVKPARVRHILCLLTVGWLLVCAGYAVQILWRV